MERQTSETIPDAAESLTGKVVTPLPGFGPAAPWTCSFCWPSLIWWSSCCWRGAALSACLLRLAWISVLRPLRCCCHGRWLLTGALAWHWRSHSPHKCWSIGHCRHQICTHLRRWHTHCCWWLGVVTHSTFLLSSIAMKKPSKTGFCNDQSPSPSQNISGSRYVKSRLCWEPLIGKLSCVIRKLKNRSVCMQSTFLLFICCCDEKSMHANLSPSY